MRAELAKRCFQSRGPATVSDCIWWSGLTAADARKGIEAMSQELNQRDGLWFGKRRAAHKPKQAHLLPMFDEYMVAYRDRSALIDPVDKKFLNAGGGPLNPCVLYEGRAIATWKRSANLIVIKGFGAITRKQKQAVADAARKYAAFVGERLGIRYA